MLEALDECLFRSLTLFLIASTAVLALSGCGIFSPDESDDSDKKPGGSDFEAVVTVSEDSIVAAMRLVWERTKLVVEPSGAVPIAALLEKRGEIEGARIGVIRSGGNVDLDRLPWSASR